MLRRLLLGWLLAAWSAGVFALELTEAERSWIVQHGAVRVLLLPTAEPFYEAAHDGRRVHGPRGFRAHRGAPEAALGAGKDGQAQMGGDPPVSGSTALSARDRTDAENIKGPQMGIDFMMMHIIETLEVI